jgi:hypothetical protein
LIESTPGGLQLIDSTTAKWSAPLEVIHPQWGKIARGGSNGTQASQA